MLPGVSNAFIDGTALDTPVSYESLAAIGSGLGSAGFVVFDDTDDLVAVSAGLSRVLTVESCGQCSPCKLDGLRIAKLFEAIAYSEARRPRSRGIAVARRYGRRQRSLFARHSTTSRRGEAARAVL